MTVVDTFFQWYGQLYPKDQQYLCAFLTKWLSVPSFIQTKFRGPSFTGRPAPPVTAKTVGNSDKIIVTCRKCGTLNEISHCELFLQ